VMVSLRSQFNAAVDVCYIDPPYNRGGNDFRYSDARFHDPDADGSDAVYVSNEDGGRHTKWMNTMAPRLAMIHEMLAPHGILFVSINDIELFRLGMLLDEIFDERNRLGVIVWRGSADNNPTRIAIEHEYIVCYAKRISEVPQVWSSPYDDSSSTGRDACAENTTRRRPRSAAKLPSRSSSGGSSGPKVSLAR
jgi:adenine-specific DNA-methyltransferase